MGLGAACLVCPKNSRLCQKITIDSALNQRMLVAWSANAGCGGPLEEDVKRMMIVSKLWATILAVGAVLSIASSGARADQITMTVGDTTYQFDPVAASADFTNYLRSDIGPSISCIGN